MISIIVPCSHMARIASDAEPHIKEDCIITIIAIEDAITDIIALLVLILFCTPKLNKEKRKGRGCAVCEKYYTSLTACPGGVNS